MSDEELVKRLRSMHWCVTTLDNGVGVSDRNVAKEAADRIEALTVEREFFEEEWVSAVDKLNKAVEALDGLLEAITATTQHGDRSLTITGPTANLKWLLETEEEARATLAEIEGEKG
jgi:hypothetical protein